LLEIPGGEQYGGIFPHSNTFDEGLGKIRPGKATITLALDGSGDCATLREAIKSLPKAGGSIYIKEGIYRISEKIEVDIANVHIFGCGKATQLLFDTVGEPNFTFSTANYLTMSDLYIKQTDGTNILQIDANSFAVFRNLWIDGANTKGIYINSSGAGFRVQNCLFVNCEDGLGCDDSTKAIITGNIFKDITADAIIGASLADSVIAHNIFDTVGGKGIDLTNAGCDTNTITANIFETITGDAIDIGDVGATGNIIADNIGIKGKVTDSGTDTFYSLTNHETQNHIRISSESMKAVGGSHGTAGVINFLNFRNAQDDEAYFTWMVPFRRKKDTNVKIILRWYYTGGDDNNDCEWNLTFDAVKPGDDPTTGTISLVEVKTSIATDDTIGETTFTITGTDLENHDDVGIKIWRDGSDALTADAKLINVHIEFTKDKQGEL